MSSEIIAAIIGGVAVIIAALIGAISVKNAKRRNLHVNFIDENRDFRNIIAKAEYIYAYTVNSYEILNRVNTILEQNQEVVIRNLMIFVRKKSDESPEDIARLNTIIDCWKNLNKIGRIRNLTIIAYDHDPDHYYILLGDRLVFCGQVLFDKARPTGTTVNYLPLVFENTDKMGIRVIKNYQDHFNNAVEKYKDTSTIYSSNH